MSRVVQDHELCQSGDQLKGQTVIITGEVIIVLNKLAID